MKPLPVRIRAGVLGIDELVVDGVDVTSATRALSFSAQEGSKSVNELHLSLVSDVEIDSEAVVVVHDSVEMTEEQFAAMIGRWVSLIDPEQLEAQALARMGQDETFAESVVGVLRDMAGVGGESD